MGTIMCFQPRRRIFLSKKSEIISLKILFTGWRSIVKNKGRGQQ
jgi:hypothetical protein